MDYSNSPSCTESHGSGLTSRLESTGTVLGASETVRNSDAPSSGLTTSPTTIAEETTMLESRRTPSRRRQQLKSGVRIRLSDNISQEISVAGTAGYYQKPEDKKERERLRKLAFSTRSESAKEEGALTWMTCKRKKKKRSSKEERPPGIESESRIKWCLPCCLAL